MDSKGRLFDNIFVERLWRSLKYEPVHLHARETGSEASAGMKNGWRSTITNVHIQPLAANHLPWSSGEDMKLPTPINRRKE